MEDPLLNSLVAGYLAQVTPKLAASFKKTVKVDLQFGFVKVLKPIPRVVLPLVSLWDSKRWSNTFPIQRPLKRELDLEVEVKERFMRALSVHFTILCVLKVVLRPKRRSLTLRTVKRTAVRATQTMSPPKLRMLQQ